MTNPSTLFNGSLCAREFGRAAVRVADLLAWATKVGAVFPVTSPDVATFQAVQIEALLCTMERGVSDMPAKSAIHASEDFECDPRLRAMINEGDATTARWVIGSRIHERWRKRIEAALEAGELRAFDALTGEPIEGAQRWAAATPDTGAGADGWLTSGQIAHLFDGVHFTHEKWQATFDKKVPKWLSGHKKVPGKPGNSSQPARWDPLGIAKALAAMKNNERRKPLSDHESKRRYDTLNVRFKLKAELAPWRDEWAAFYSWMQDD